MKPVVFFRQSVGFEHELDVASQHFDLYTQRSTLPSNSLVIPRYSCLPFYKELEADIHHINSKLINSYSQHTYVANLAYWYQDLKDLTPKTWFQLHEIPEKGLFILKGKTNSKKFSWDTHMFARDKREAIDVFLRLQEDGLIGEQDIVIRKYVPLFELDKAPRGLPISEEYRFFVLDRKVVSGAFYWSSHVDDLDKKYDASVVPESFLAEVINKVGDQIRFYVVDVARTANDDWIVIELNDGQMSGLSENDPHTFYKNLKQML